MTAALYTAEQRAEWEKLGLVLVSASPGSPYDILKPKEKQNGHVTIRQRAAMAHFVLAREGKVSKYVKTVQQQENNEMAKAKAADKAAPAQAAEGSKGEEQQATPAAAPAAAKPAAAKSDLEKAADTARSEAEAKAATKSKSKKKTKKGIPDVLPDARKYLSDAAKKRLDKEEAARKKGGKDKKAKPEKPEKPERKKQTAQPKKAGGGIGGVVCEMLLKGKDTDDILKAIKEKFPKAKTSAASVAWYRSQLRGEGKLK